MTESRQVPYPFPTTDTSELVIHTINYEEFNVPLAFLHNCGT